MDVVRICVFGVNECQEATTWRGVMIVCVWLRGIVGVIKEECSWRKVFLRIQEVFWK